MFAAFMGSAMFCLCASGAPVEAPLVYEQMELSLSMGPGASVGDMSAPFPGTDWKAPDLVSDKPLYLVFPVGDRLMILDKESKDDFAYNRLYLDVNGNRDLTEHPPLIGEIRDSSWATYTDFANVVLPGANNGADYYFHLALTQVRPGLLQGVRQAITGVSADRPGIFVFTGFTYSAEVEVDGEKYRLRLVDANVDGRFEPGVPSDERDRRHRGDVLMVEQAGRESEKSWQPLGSYLALGGSVFKFDADTVAGKLALTPVEGETGRLKIENSFETLTLAKSGPRPEYVMMYRPSGSLPLPRGAYSVVQYDLIAEGDSGVVWRVSTKSGQPAQFEIEEGQELAAPFGQPLVARAVVDGNRIKTGLFWRKYADLTFVLEGAGGEPLDYPVAFEDGRRVHRIAPAYRVTSGDGELVAQGRFEYG